jgi:hypothetical protein
MPMTKEHITTDDLDTATHALSQVLKATGLDLSPEAMTSLNDNIESFLREELSVEVISGESEIKAELRFNTVLQALRSFQETDQSENDDVLSYSEINELCEDINSTGVIY